ncbi:NAC domain-containing protein 2-like [Rosa rugosa]|uniref:NAC domain-containing protein 2-like n=1 Tax=Rosa rugosa TaxID=74645 RepID=UPI002B40FE50|nr:NAC domain-containing protein 2-like [Rosa rugosa]
MEGEGGYMLLPGQRFCPMEDELLMYYLKPKVNGEEVPGKEALICELDLYGEQEPWNIWERYEATRANDLRRNKDLYFFTKKKKVSAKASRIRRKVGSGSWKGLDAAKEIYLLDDQNRQPTTTLLGFKKTYTYKNTSSVHHGRWIMYEFELDESQLLHKKQQVNKNEYSLCLLRKNDILPEKKKKRKLRQEEENHEMLQDNVPISIVNTDPESEPQAKRPCTHDNVPAPAPSLLDFAQLEKWYDQQQFLLPAEPQPSWEENLGQIPTFSANELMSGHQDKNQVQQMPAEDGILTPGEVDLYGGNLSDVVVGANWPNSFIGELVEDEQPYTMEAGEWNDFLVQILTT